MQHEKQKETHCSNFMDPIPIIKECRSGSGQTKKRQNVTVYFYQL